MLPKDMSIDAIKRRQAERDALVKEVKAKSEPKGGKK